MQITDYKPENQRRWINSNHLNAYKSFLLRCKWFY